MWSSNQSLLNSSERSTLAAACDVPSNTNAEIIAKVLGYAVVMIVSLVGNSLVVFIVLRTQDLQGTINYLIVNMAFSDLIIPVVVIPRQMTNIISSMPVSGWLVPGILGDILCKCVTFLQDLSTAVSVQTLVLITIERCMAVVYPMKVKFITKKKRGFLIACTWIIGSTMHSPYFYALKTLQNENDSNVYCVLNWEPSFNHHTAHRFYTTFMAIIFILIPFAVIAILYIIILVTLKTRGIGRYQTGSGRRIRRKENRNVLFMALAVVLTFAVCWAPFNIFIFLYIFVWNFQTPCFSKSIEFIGYFFAYSISAINPCLYFIFVKKYKEALKRLVFTVIPVKWRRKQSSFTENETVELRDALRKRESRDITLSVL